MRQPSLATRSVLGVVLCALAAAGARSYVARRRGAVAEAPRRRAAQAIGLRSAWKTRVPFDAANVYAASRWVVADDGTDYAVLDAGTGHRAFTRHREQRVWPPYHAVLVTPDGVVIEPGVTALQAWDVGTGTLRWRAELDASGVGRPDLLRAAGGRVVACGQGRLVAFDDMSGARRWEADVPDCGDTSIDARRVYVATTGELVAFDLRTGERSWAVPTPSEPVPSAFVPAHVVAADGRVAIRGTRPGQVVILHGATGRHERDVVLQGVDVTSLAARGDFLLVNGGGASFGSERVVVMVSLATGEELWRTQDGRWTLYDLAEDAVYASDVDDARLYALDLRSGRALWHQDTACDHWIVGLESAPDEPAIRFATTSPDGRGGAVVTGVAEASTLPVEDARIEGRIQADEMPPLGLLRMRVGEVTVPVGRDGRFSARVRARGSIVIRPAPDSSQGEWDWNVQPMTLWLDGRRGVYEVSPQLTPRIQLE